MMTSKMVSTPTNVFVPSPREPRLHLAWVDGLRAVAALFVVMHHAYISVPSHSDTVWNNWLNYGHFAVDVFIMISGFCLMLPVISNRGVLRGGVADFFKRRARRILPPYYWAMALSWMLIVLLIGHKTGTHWDDTLPVTPQQIVIHLLLLQDILGDSGGLNYVFWSIAVEWQIYFVFPIMLIVWRKIGAVPATGAITLFSYALYGLVRGTLWEGITCQYLALFAFGMLAAEIASSPLERWARLKRPGTLGSVFAGAALILIALCHRWGTSGHWVVLDMVVGIATFVLLIGASLPGTNRLRTVLSGKPLVTVGTFAYSIYLIHAPILQIVWQYGLHPLHLRPGVELDLEIGGGTALSVGCAYLFFLVGEKPWLVRRRAETLEEVAQEAAASPAP